MNFLNSIDKILYNTSVIRRLRYVKLDHFMFYAFGLFKNKTDLQDKNKSPIFVVKRMKIVIYFVSVWQICTYLLLYACRCRWFDYLCTIHTFVEYTLLRNSFVFFFFFLLFCHLRRMNLIATVHVLSVFVIMRCYAIVLARVQYILIFFS